MESEMLSLVMLRVLQVLAVGCIVSAIVFFSWPNKIVQGINKALNQWVSTKKLEEQLEKVRNVDPMFISMRRFMGIISLILAVILVYLCYTYKL